MEKLNDGTEKQLKEAGVIADDEDEVVEEDEEEGFGKYSGSGFFICIETHFVI